MAGIFRAYDIRGVYPAEINTEIVHKIGFAFAQFLGQSHIVIGRDMRDASSALAHAFADGVLAAGVDVTDIGMVTTPMLYYAIIDGRFGGGAMVTASHLPARYNGIKLCREKAIPLSGDDGLPEVESAVQRIASVPTLQTGHYDELSFLDRYVDRMVAFVKYLEPLKIVVDAGNGMGGLDAPVLLARFPNYELVPMYMNPDGSFPHHVPNPALEETTRDLQARVIAEGADLGVAFDGDGDRCAFVDERGERIPADLAMAILAELFLRETPEGTILYDLRASQVVPEYIRELGGRPVKTRVGHSFIKERMRKEDAVFAGELAGHYYYRDLGYTDSGIRTMIAMLNLLGIKGVPASQLVRPLQKYVRTDEINVAVQDTSKLFRELQDVYSDGEQEHLDGLTVTYAHWWFNLRQSHTEPVVRLVIEAEDEIVLQDEEARLLAIVHHYENGGRDVLP